MSSGNSNSELENLPLPCIQADQRVNTPTLSRLTTDGPRIPLLDKCRKRGRVESAGFDFMNRSNLSIRIGGNYSRRRFLKRSASLPNLYYQSDRRQIQNIFPDINPKDLRLAEVKSWKCPWMDCEFSISPQIKKTHIKQNVILTTDEGEDINEIDSIINQMSNDFVVEDKRPIQDENTSFNEEINPNIPKRPVLRLKLEDMPTPQQAEVRAQRAAHKLIAKHEAIEKALNDVASSNADENECTPPKRPTLKLNFKSYSSGEDSDIQSPNDGGRTSVGSAYSPNHGMFTTKTVAVSEAGISSPDSTCLHLQENLERVKEIGRGASGVVHKAIHIPTLKVVAVKDVPVYGRGQRRQMVRELHALYSNLVPIADSSEHSTSNAKKQKPKKASPYIVSFYDAFVDRPKNCICLVMEYMSAGSLQDIVLKGGCQNEMILSRIALGVLHGLAHIHKKYMVHRDIKPHNLLMNRQGEVKISDFGLARTLTDTVSSTKTFVGTLLYMAPERIGGGDYSYSADIWSFGLVLISVALGRYPLPTQDGFFGLVDSVANEKYLQLPVDIYSKDCRDFIENCLRIDPKERLTAEQLLQHPFVNKYSENETFVEWLRFIDAAVLCEEREEELESLADAVYRHIYERVVKFSYQPQSDYGVLFLSQAQPSLSNREVTIAPVEMSLQLGLANYLGIPAHKVYEQFEMKRLHYCEKLLDNYCYSPQSWTASPGVSRRQQLFGRDSESPRLPQGHRTVGSFWRKLQDRVSKFGKKKKDDEEKEWRKAS